MKKIAFILYTCFCFAMGSLLFQGTTDAGGSLSGKYFSAYNLSLSPSMQSAYYETFGVSFTNPVTRQNVIVDWKSNQNFVVYLQK